MAEPMIYWSEVVDPRPISKKQHGPLRARILVFALNLGWRRWRLWKLPAIKSWLFGRRS